MSVAESPRTLRIGIDARELQGRRTGVGRYLLGLLKAWPEDGDALILFSHGPAPLDLPPRRTPFVHRPLGDGGARGLVFQERLLPKAAEREGLDCFFAPAYSCPLSLRVPRVTAIHDWSFFSLPEDFPFQDALRRRVLVGQSVGRSKLLLALSDFTKREILARFPDAASRVRVVLPGADDDLPPSRATRGGTGPRLLAVGSILNRRRIPELLQAVAELRARHGGLRLDVVGENRTYPRLDIARLVSRLELGGSVSFRGFLDEQGLADLYAQADVAVYLSEYEGFGLPVLEALSRGVPVVTSVKPATGEVFRGAAALVDPADASAVARAIAGILGDDGLRKELVVTGRRLVETLTWRRAAAAVRGALVEAAS